MKKAKILAVILVMSLMLTGVAYALWNENVTLSTTAAMGEMDLAITCDNHIYPLSFMPGIGALGRTYTYADMEDYMNPLTGCVSADRQSITVTVGDMYPGAKYGLNYAIRNTGDVPFKLKGVTVTCTDNSALFAKLTGSFQFLYQKADGATTPIFVSASAMTADRLGNAIADACKDIVVYPGDELVGYRANQDEVSTFMQVMVDGTITGDEFENQSTSFVVDFNWEQCNPVYFPGV
ncbi:MAG: hypothetical protein KBI01_02945 [Oscillospiraceae bacterium]|nr:hypothetical protein [Oscillospiraceae bacterium]